MLAGNVPPLRSLLSTVKAMSPGVYSTVLSSEWMQGRTTYGGCSAALCLEAAKRELDDPGLPLRSALVSFVGPAGNGVEISTSRLRQGSGVKGKGMAFMRSDLSTTEDAQIATSATFAFGAPRLASGFNSSLVPPPPADLLSPEECPSFFPEGRAPSSFRPVFTHNFEARLAKGALNTSSAPLSDADLFIWVRHLGGNETTGGVEGVAADVALLALADMPPPAIVPCFHTPSPISSATWQVNFLKPDRLSPEPCSYRGGWFLLRTRLESAHVGFSSQDMTVWGAGGEPMCVGRQSVAIYDKEGQKEQGRSSQPPPVPRL